MHYWWPGIDRTLLRSNSPHLSCHHQTYSNCNRRRRIEKKRYEHRIRNRRQNLKETVGNGAIETMSLSEGHADDRHPAALHRLEIAHAKWWIHWRFVFQVLEAALLECSEWQRKRKKWRRNGKIKKYTSNDKDSTNFQRNRTFWALMQYVDSIRWLHTLCNSYSHGFSRSHRPRSRLCDVFEYLQSPGTGMPLGLTRVHIKQKHDETWWNKVS